MIRILRSKSMGRADHGWLKSLFHFSFAEYQNPKNIQFGNLRVLNDDLVAPGTGFDPHPHRDMEIISYVVDGELTHGDNMGHEETLTRGHVQYMSAGSGVVHSEYNRGSKTARFLQIWIFPNARGLKPNYGDYRFEWKDRVGRWLALASGTAGEAPIAIHQDARLFAAYVEPGTSLSFDVGSNRQVYLVNIEGTTTLEDETMEAKDAAEIVGKSFTLKSDAGSHVLAIEMATPSFD